MPPSIQRSLKTFTSTIFEELQKGRLAEQLFLVNECEKIPLKVRKPKEPLIVKENMVTFDLKVDILETVEPKKIEYKVDLGGWSPSEGEKSLLHIIKRAGRDLAKWEDILVRDRLLSGPGKTIVTKDAYDAIRKLSDFIIGNGYVPDNLLIHPAGVSKLAEMNVLSRLQLSPDLIQLKGSSFIGILDGLDVYCTHFMKRDMAVIFDHLEVEFFRTPPKISFDSIVHPKTLTITEELLLLPTTAALGVADFGI